MEEVYRRGKIYQSWKILELEKVGMVIYGNLGLRLAPSAR